MRIKTYKRIVLSIMLAFSVLFLGSIAYSGYNLYIYHTSPVVKGEIVGLGTDWSGGSWTCTVDYEWEKKPYTAEIWYHVTNDVGDMIHIHINEADPGTPYSDFWWKFIIVVAGFFEILNIIVCVKKIKNVTRGITIIGH